MSAAGTRTGLASSLPRGRSPLAHLLHALNQPLTGLQCSLELAVSGPHSTEHYTRTLREGLELTCRMRVLVEALRELADTQPSNSKKITAFMLDELLLSTAVELEPVAKENGIGLQLATSSPLPVRADRDRLAAILFRGFESALSLSAKNSVLEVTTTSERGSALAELRWTQDVLPVYSPFSREELGLLIAQAGWEQAGGEWRVEHTGNRQICTLRMPLCELGNVRTAQHPEDCNERRA